MKFPTQKEYYRMRKELKLSYYLFVEKRIHLLTDIE